MVQAILDGRKTQMRRVIKPQPCIEATAFHRFIHTEDCGWEARFSNDNSNAVCDRKLRIDKGDILYVRETWVGKCDGGRCPVNPQGDEYYPCAFEHCPCPFDTHKYLYRADQDKIGEVNGFDIARWKPSIYMPKAAARIFLRVIGVRVEQLQDIKEADAIAEGVVRQFDHLSDDEYNEWMGRICAVQNIPFVPKCELGYNNYLWHGNFGKYGMGNKQSDAWEYQYSTYRTAVDSFSSLWELTNAKRGYGWNADLWVLVYEFERVEKNATDETQKRFD